MHHHAQLIFYFCREGVSLSPFFFFKDGFHHVGQSGLELPTSGDPPTSASQSAGITGMSHRAGREGVSFFVCFFETEFRSCYPGWSAMV